jgi:hypothetical protein
MFQNCVSLAILLRDYDTLNQDTASFLEEEPLDHQLNDQRAKKASKKLRKSSFYLKNLSLEEVSSLMESNFELVIDFYTRKLTESTTNTQGRDVFQTILIYTDLLMSIEGFKYRQVDAKSIQKKLKMKTLFTTGTDQFYSSIHQSYEQVVVRLRYQLFTEIIKKVQKIDSGKGAKLNDLFKLFYIKVALYLLAGKETKSITQKQTLSELKTGSETSLLTNSEIQSENNGTSITPDYQKEKHNIVDDELNKASDRLLISNELQTNAISDFSSSKSQDKVEKKIAETNLDDDFSTSPQGYSSSLLTSGGSIDDDLFMNLLECSFNFYQFRNIEDYLIEASTSNLLFSKDLLYGAQISKDFKPILYQVLYHLLRTSLNYFTQTSNHVGITTTLQAIEGLFLNLLILDEILRKSFMQDKARFIEAVEVSLLWILSSSKEREELGDSSNLDVGDQKNWIKNQIIDAGNNLMRMIFRTYLTKLDFKVIKSSNIEFQLQSCESNVDKPLFSFAGELLERKYRLIENSVSLPEHLYRQLTGEDSPNSQEGIPPTIFGRSSGLTGDNASLEQDLVLYIQTEVSKLYTATDILSALGLSKNEQMLAASSAAERVLPIADLIQAFRFIRGTANEGILELAFKLEGYQATIETDIAQHDERYERTLTYLKNKIEVSGISSESVMRSCRFAAQKMAKEQRDINGLWRARDMPSALQIDEPFSPEVYRYEGVERNKYYDFGVENFCTSQKTRPFLKYDVRRYWSDNYDDVFIDEEKDGAKSVYTALNSRAGKMKRAQATQNSKQVKQTGFLLFQVKKNRHKSKYRHRMMAMGVKDTDDLDKLFNENMSNDQVVFGKKCQLIEKFKIWKGFLYLYRDKLYFYINTFEISNYFSSQTKELKSFDKLKRMWNVSSIRDMKIRRLNQRRSAIELFFKDGYSIFINFNSCNPAEKDVTAFYQKLKSVISLSNPKLDPTKLMHFAPVKQFEALRLTERWLNGELSNFEYLFEVNLYSGRSYNDLSQYPIYPWVIMIDYLHDIKSCDFLSGDLEEFFSNLTNRDLDNNIGSIGDKGRLKNYVKRYTSARYFDSHVPAYHYGSHYSTPAIVIYFLLRLFPFTEGAIDFQSGSFDIADRLFHSVQKCFKNAMEEMSDVRELIPEFFYLPEFLLNMNKLNLGILHTEERVNNVELPAWTDQNPFVFVYVLRKILEGKEVSTNLGSWIDLIFGSKQTGPESIEKTNVFYYLTYDGQVDMDALPEEDKDAIETQVLHFGQTPSQLFLKDHPSLTEGNPRFLFSISREKQKMMLYKRTKQDSHLTEHSSPVRSLWLNAAYNAKLHVSCVKGLAVDSYLWETKTAKDMTTQNAIPFRLAHQGEASFADCLLQEATDCLDRSLFDPADAPLVFLPDKKALAMAGFLSGSVRLPHPGQALQLRQEEGQRLQSSRCHRSQTLRQPQPDLPGFGFS